MISDNETQIAKDDRGLLVAERPVALFLDFDGTLVDIAPLPDAVKPDRRLAPTLNTLRGVLGGALALVSGRPIPVLDGYLEPYRFDVAGLHGAQIRVDGEIRSQEIAPDSLRQATRELVRFANGHVGILVEDKRLSVALHWRLAPELETDALGLMEGLAARLGPAVRLQKGKLVAEIVPAGASKGSAIAQLMESAAYAGRCPVFIGDDVTDEIGFMAVNDLGGLSIRIGEGQTAAAHRISSPTRLLNLLITAAESGTLTADTFLQG